MPRIKSPLVTLLAAPAITLALGGCLAGTLAGCSEYRPQGYGKERPPVDRIDSRDKGLQSKDVVVASDQAAMDLLANLPSNDQKVIIVIDRVENLTQNARFDMDIFLDRLRTNVYKYGKGRVQIQENRAKLRDIQSRELEGEREDFGQGAGPTAPGPAGIQPNYGLYARASELPNRGTSYFLINFILTDLRTREQVWVDQYEVKTAR